jgi:ABC-2 type transport system permease protein
MNQVKLVIERELSVRMYSKPYIIGTTVMALIGVIICAVLHYWGPQIFGSMAATLPTTGFEGDTEALNEVLHQYGINPAEFLEKLQLALLNADDATSVAESMSSTFGAIAGIIVPAILMISIMVYGAGIALGVVEEKSSQIVEILLATLRPWQLMLGKIIGIGLSGLLQMFVILGATLAAAFGFGLTGALSGLGLDLTRIVLWSLAWFLVGFFSYACLFAAAGSTATKPEEVQDASAPITLLVVLAYYASLFITSGEILGPEWALWANSLKFIPLLSPLLMPGAVLSGQATDIEGLIGLGVSLAALPVIVMLASRIYSRSILQLGARVKIWSVLRKNNS